MRAALRAAVRAALRAAVQKEPIPRAKERYVIFTQRSCQFQLSLIPFLKDASSGSKQALHHRSGVSLFIGLHVFILRITCFYSSDYMFLFIGLHGINGTLTTFLGLRTDFKRKLDLTVVAIPPKAGKRPAYTGQSQACLYGASPMAARPNPFKFRA